MMIMMGSFGPRVKEAMHLNVLLLMTIQYCTTNVAIAPNIVALS